MYVCGCVRSHRFYSLTCVATGSNVYVGCVLVLSAVVARVLTTTVNAADVT
jgi:hypothetical protein